jgi:hypothetical protein
LRSFSVSSLGRRSFGPAPASEALDERPLEGDKWSRGPRADRPGSAHGVPFVGMRGSLPRAPACAGALFYRLAAPIAVASRPAPARLVARVAWSPFAPPFARGVRPDGTGSTSRPHLSTLAAAGSQTPVSRGCTELHERRNRVASTSRSA